MTLIRLILLGVFGYLLYKGVRPYLKPKNKLDGAPTPKRLPQPERFDGKLPHEILGVAADAHPDAARVVSAS